MHIETTTKVANSLEVLEKLLERISSGRLAKPDWIKLQGKCRLDKMGRDQRESILDRLHGCVLRGFRANNVDFDDEETRLAYWRSVARKGFHDFSEQGWMKSYDSPFREDYDYIGPYLDGGLSKLDAYAAYTAVLGTFDFTVEDFVNTELCPGVRTIVEPMAGTAEFAYHSHFHRPDFRYVMIDLDAEAQERVLAQRWLEMTEKHYLIANILDESVWDQVKSITTGESLAYVGKQSHHLFGAKEIFRLLEVATQRVDYLMLETPQLAPVTEMGGTDDVSRTEMEDAGLEVELIEDPDGEPNPFTNLMHFHLGASDKTGRRRLFEYRDWTVWSQPTLVAMARVLDLNAFYFHSETHEFTSVDEEWEDSDVEDEVTFMLFTRRDLPPSA
ncbi:MAG: hypothetical protein OSB70_06050 [Myxococcota bacterium]|nr:hypothetical protein [Myxococcota bacterium]